MKQHEKLNRVIKAYKILQHKNAKLKAQATLDHKFKALVRAYDEELYSKMVKLLKSL